GLFKIRKQFLDVVRKCLRVACEVPPQSASRRPAGTGSAAEPQLDATGVERSQGSELFRDDERSVIRQHDTTGADGNGLGAAGDVSKGAGGGVVGVGGYFVVSGEPVAVVSPSLGVLREVKDVAQGQSSSPALRNRGKIEDGKWNHGHWMLRERAGVRPQATEQ